MQKLNDIQLSQHSKIKYSKKILVVDDDIDNVEILNLFLNHLGYFDIQHCFNGKDAYELIIEQQFDLVFLDVRMPIWDGYQTLEKLKLYQESNSHLHTTIIVVSANSFQEDIEKSISHGAQFHISKPISINKIQNIIEQVE